MTMYDDLVTLVEEAVLSLAEAMPAERYDFAPTEGAVAGVRTFGEQVRHVAAVIFMTSALVLEERPPYGPGTHNNGPDDIRSKAEVIRFLKASLVYARRAMASLTAANHLESVPSAFGPMPRSAMGMSARGALSYSTSPSVGLSNPAITLSSVVLPHPEGPMMLRVSPSRMVSERSFMALARVAGSAMSRC